MSDEKKKRLPTGWVWSTIGEVAKTQAGGTPSRTRPEFFGGSIPWVKSGELGDGVVHAAEEFITQLGLDSSSAKLFPKGTLCIALYGATVGKVGILAIDAATNQAVFGIFLPSNIDTRFVFRYLQSIRRDLVSQSQGGAQPNISGGLVRQTALPLPPPDEQHRIVAKIEELFSDLDAGVAALERVKANLKRYRAAVLKAAVEGRLTAKWREQHPNTEPAAKLLDRILTARRQKWEADQLAKFKSAGKTPPKGWQEKYEAPVGPDTKDFPKLPKGWCWATMDQLIGYLRNGWSLKPSPAPPGFRILRINAVRPMEVDLDEFRFVDEAKEAVEGYFIQPGDLLFTRYNGSVDLLGVCALVRKISEPTLHPDKLIRVRTVFDEPMNSFAEVACNVGISRKHMRGRTRTTAGQTGISGTDIRQMPMPVCSLDEQSQIIKEVESRLAMASRSLSFVEASLKRAARLRQSILKRAYEGRLVPQDPKDAPATMFPLAQDLSVQTKSRLRRASIKGGV